MRKEDSVAPVVNVAVAGTLLGHAIAYAIAGSPFGFLFNAVLCVAFVGSLFECERRALALHRSEHGQRWT
jgi:hypothetical protein